MHQFNDHSNISIIGCSGSGKTSLVHRILKHAEDMFPTKPTRIIYIYSIWQDIYEALKEVIDGIIFINYLPEEEEVVSLCSGNDHSIIIYDDCMTEMGDNQVVSKLVTKLCHHLKITSILIAQNSGYGGKYKSNIVKNTHYTILLHSPRDFYIVRSIGTQLGDYQTLLCSYKDAMKIGSFSYLLIDTHPRSDTSFKYRTCIFPDEDSIVYCS
jgi:hypothetical protein